ncbi:hypothetical protein PCANC_10058 [Puccinia coronata f. sp. avenae]|uniref:Uncharacterized protein n=1 Tax=Puccinia coronata f. sp. avenae TaxID=200324 RepID=A0A2N5V0G7_9BASI|nr:hypothetical protein PCANC_10058 [Puccinia coronata f. sp. avenae]
MAASDINSDAAIRARFSGSVDHHFWNNGLYFHTKAPWAIKPNVRAGINYVLILARVQEEVQLLAQELAWAVGWGVSHYTRFSDSISYINQRIIRLDNENDNDNNEGVKIDYIDQLNMALLNDWQILMDNIRSKKARTTSSAGEVDDLLKDDVLEDIHDNGEDGNADKDWVTNNKEEDDAEGTGNRGGKDVISGSSHPSGHPSNMDANGNGGEPDNYPANQQYNAPQYSQNMTHVLAGTAQRLLVPRQNRTTGIVLSFHGSQRGIRQNATRLART